MARKLSDEQRREIRASRESSVVLSFRFGVSASRIRKIRGACVRCNLAKRAKTEEEWRGPGMA